MVAAFIVIASEARQSPRRAVEQENQSHGRVRRRGRLHRGSEKMPEVTEKSRIEQENQSHGRACRRVRFFEQEYDGAGST